MSDLGRVKPVYGRWVWPFKHMEEGDSFTVLHADRDPEALRRMVHVRGVQLGKRFSFEKSFEEGVARVSCIGRGVELDGPITLEDIMS